MISFNIGQVAPNRSRRDSQGQLCSTYRLFQLQPSVSTLILVLCFPLRPVASALCLSASVSLGYSIQYSRIDLSTSVVLKQEIDIFSVCFKSLKHHILDRCGLSTMREGEWSVIGKCCALAGVPRAREREKTLKTWLET